MTDPSTNGDDGAVTAQPSRGVDDFDQVVERYRTTALGLVAQVRRRIVGQNDVVRDVITSLLCGGHVLLEGVPGLGKTELLKTLAECAGVEFGRIQFTPDLMPADVVGTEVLDVSDTGARSLQYRPGPVFTNLLLADEINRATPKTQSALLEAMQERHVTVAGVTRPLPSPFMVLATQNPIELEGTYPLPEAQLDRFFMKVVVRSPSEEVLGRILSTTTTTAVPSIDAACGPDDLAWMISTTRRVPIAPHLIGYAARLIRATHPDADAATPAVRRYVRSGSSPRGGQALVLAAKARALLRQRPHVAGSDLLASAPAVLRHRLLLGYDADADGVDVDDIVAEVVEQTTEPHEIAPSTSGEPERSASW